MATIRGVVVRAEILASNPAPSCPCGFGIMRQKCAFELGGDCERHAIREEWEQLVARLERAERSSDAGDIPIER